MPLRKPFNLAEELTKEASLIFLILISKRGKTRKDDISHSKRNVSFER